MRIQAELDDSKLFTWKPKVRQPSLKMGWLRNIKLTGDYPLLIFAALMVSLSNELIDFTN